MLTFLCWGQSPVVLAVSVPVPFPGKPMVRVRYTASALEQVNSCCLSGSLVSRVNVCWQQLEPSWSGWRTPSLSLHTQGWQRPCVVSSFSLRNCYLTALTPEKCSQPVNQPLWPVVIWLKRPLSCHKGECQYLNNLFLEYLHFTPLRYFVNQGLVLSAVLTKSCNLFNFSAVSHFMSRCLSHVGEKLRIYILEDLAAML